MTTAANAPITHHDVQTALENKGFEVYGEDTGGGCWVSYAVKGEGTRVTLGPFGWDREIGSLVVTLGDFYIGPDEMDEETGESFDVELINVPEGSTVEDIVAIASSEYAKLNA